MPTVRAAEYPDPGHQLRRALRQAWRAWLALAVALALAAPASSQPDLAPRALEPEELDAATVQRAAARFELDTVVYEVLSETGVPGAVAAVAAAGELIAAEAYGTADVATGRALTLDDPLWLASVTKLPVAIAVLDLVARERLQLGTPLADLLGAEMVPPPPPGDTTVLAPWHLLTHTSGFGDRLLNTADVDGGPNPPLERLPLPARVDPAGSGPRYGNAGHHALGLLLEAVTGDDVETALRTLVFEPLGLDSAQLLRPAPADYEAATARGHERDLRGALRPLMPPTLFDPSAGQLRLSGRDAAALLAELTAEAPSGPLGNDVRTALLTPAARGHPQAAGTTLGMTEGWMLGHEVVLHAGDLRGLHSLLVLVPAAGLGLFVHVNGPEREGGEWSTVDGMRDARWLLAERLLEQFLGDARTPPTAVPPEQLPPGARADAGVYRPEYAPAAPYEALLTLVGLIQFPVDVLADGSVVVRTPPDLSPHRRYLPTAEGVYRRDGGGDVLAVTRDERGAPLLHGALGMPVTLERVPLLERVEVLLACLLLAALGALVALVSWPLGSWRRWRSRGPRSSDPSSSVMLLRWLARVLALATLAWFVVHLGAAAEVQRGLTLDVDAFRPLASATVAAVGVLALALVVVGVALALGGWGARPGGPRLRPRAAFHVVLGLAGLALVLQAWVWRLPPWS